MGKVASILYQGSEVKEPAPGSGSECVAVESGVRLEQISICVEPRLLLRGQHLQLAWRVTLVEEGHSRETGHVLGQNSVGFSSCFSFCLKSRETKRNRGGSSCSLPKCPE